MCGTNAKKAGIKKAVLDIGLQGKSRRIFAALKGALDAGLDIPHGEIATPADMIAGKHIEAYLAKSPKGVFGTYKKEGIDAKNFVEHINKVKAAIGTTGGKSNAK